MTLLTLMGQALQKITIEKKNGKLPIEVWENDNPL